MNAIPTGGLLDLIPGLAGAEVGLTATGGGTVAWSATVTGDPDGLVTVSPASGTLTPGRPGAVVTITASGVIACRPGNASDQICPTVTFSPGGPTFSIVTGPTLPSAQNSIQLAFCDFLIADKTRKLHIVFVRYR